MSDPTPHVPPLLRHGDPTWIDLSTHDLPAARDFYSALFGWEFVDQGEDFGGYHMIFLDGAEVGGAMSSFTGPDGPGEEPLGPTTWTVYLKVDDIDAAVRDTVEQGGTVLFGPVTVGDAGRMGVVADPAGATVGFWEVGQFPGFSQAGTPGLPVWFEVMSRDFDAALPFYGKVARWDPTYLGEDGEQPTAQPDDAPTGPGDIRYATNFPEQYATAGICEADSFLPEGVSGFWRHYIAVEDVDAAVDRLRGLGGTLLDGPEDSPFGRLATVADPQGASFQIIRPAGS